MPPLVGAWAGPARVPDLPVHLDVLHGLVGRRRLPLNVQEGVPVVLLPHPAELAILSAGRSKNPTSSGPWAN